MEPLVSIIVPVYNADEYIKHGIDSILNQTYKNLEIVIVNDGSSDRSEDIILKMSKNNKNIIYYSQENSGPSVARNKGIEISKGDYIVFMDIDDTIEEKYIEKLVKSVVENKCDIVTCGYTDISKYGKLKLNDFYYGKYLVPREEFIDNIFKGVGGTLWGKIFNRDIIVRNNIKMNPNIYMCEDMIFVLEYAMDCSIYGTLNDSLYNYNRLNENSISSKIDMDYYGNLIDVLKEIEKILTKNNFDINYIDNILKNRVQSMVTTFATMQHNKKHNYSKAQKLYNLEIILENGYIKRYKTYFEGSTIKEKIMIRLIQQNKIGFLNYYSLLLYNIQLIKDKIRFID